MVIVPASLYLSTDDLSSIMEALARDSARQKAFQKLDKEHQLALLLAYERRRGSKSFYAPYINILPAQPPCPWLMEQSKLQAALDKLGCAKEERFRLQLLVQQTRRNASQLCSRLEETYGLLLGIKGKGNLQLLTLFRR